MIGGVKFSLRVGQYDDGDTDCVPEGRDDNDGDADGAEDSEGELYDCWLQAGLGGTQ